MAILCISRPALFCLLLWLTLSQEARDAKCRNPNGDVGETRYEGCHKKTCVKASRRSAIWVETPVLDICCVQNATLFPTGRIIQESKPNPNTLVLLKCEKLEDVPSIVPEVYNINPPLEKIEAKLNNLTHKAEEILEAVKECCDCEEEQEQGCDWVKVFSHDVSGGLFTSNEEALSKNGDDPSAKLFSRLDQLERFRGEDGKFHFKIVYPLLGGSNEWIQTSNPATSNTTEGYRPIYLDYKIDGIAETWGGLGLCSGRQQAFICDTPTTYHWFMCVGCQSTWKNPNTIPGPYDYATSQVEIYVKSTGCSKGVLIAGGVTGLDSSTGLKSAELFNPNTGETCPVGDLPKITYHFSSCNGLQCGGAATSYRSCTRFEPNGTFSQTSVYLNKDRSAYVCWPFPSGEVLLMGGYFSKTTTELVAADGSSSTPNFTLAHDTDSSCGINLGETYVVTGGWNAFNQVTEYFRNGDSQALPPLLTGRQEHGCGSYVDSDGVLFLLVTSGKEIFENGGWKVLSSTEIFRYSEPSGESWKPAAALPTPAAPSEPGRFALGSITFENSVYVFGGWSPVSGSHDEIYKYDPESDEWTRAGTMGTARHWFAVGLVEYDKNLCV